MAMCSDEKEKDFKFIFMSIRDGLRDLNVPMNEHNLVLIADSSDAIRNAFQKTLWKNHNMVMCCAHMRKCIIKKLCLIEDKDLICEIMGDLDTSQLSKNSIVFKIATNLFLKKWKGQERFIEYFSSQ